MDKKLVSNTTKRELYLKQLGEHIAQIRKEQDYTQDRLYLEAGFSRGTLSKIERGLVNPQIWTLQIIAKTIGVPLAKLVTISKK
jgi:DNA-binding XRE family transcriptional regulator